MAESARPTRAPHVVPANRLAFTTPVRESSSSGHWITLHSAEDPAEGTVHCFVGGGGYIEKGPKALVHQHIGALAAHPSVARTTQHPAGHEPPGARDHPDFHEAGPKPRAAQPAEGDEPAKRPGKPYARLHGADQGTRTEQIGKALMQAQGAAQGASEKAEAERAARRRQVADDQAARNRDVKSKGHQAFIGEHEYFHLPSGDLVRARREGRLDENGHRVGARDVAPAHRASETLRQHIADAGERGVQVSGPAAQRNASARVSSSPAASKPFVTPQTEKPPEEKVADTAVAHQQAQAALAAHRAAHDRNPNPWAPHLSPPVGDAKDRELQEKATRAQLAHQAAQAQQQGAQQAEQQEGQRAHEKDMVRVKAEATQQAAPLVPLKGRLAGLMSPEEQARLQAEHAARPQQALPEQPKALPPKEGTLLRDQPSPSGKRRLEAPAAPAQRAPESRAYTSRQLSDMEPEQREAVAADKTTHPETLHELGLWNRKYAQKVARNPSTRPETLHAMTQEMPYDPKMDAGIARHKNARPETLHHLAVHGDNPVKALVAAHPNAAEATRQHVLEGYPTGNILHGLAKNPHTSAEHLEQVRRKSDDAKGVPTRQAIAEHQGAAEGTLHNLAHDYHPVATALAGRKAPLPEGVIETLARRKEPAVHSALLDRPDLPGRHVYHLARNGAPDVARKAQAVMDRRDAHARGGKRPVREAATPTRTAGTLRFSAPVVAR